MSGVGFGRGFPRVWLLPIVGLTVLLGVAAFGRLSRSIVADLIAWWPVWVGLGVAAYAVRERTVGIVRLSGIVPLFALVFVVLFTMGHLGGWALMPSASHRLVGPETGGTTRATLAAEVDGVVELRGGADYLYQVEPVMRGGTIGIPGASEQAIDSTVSVLLEPPADPGLYGFAGWDIALADQPLWSLTLDGAVDADLSSLVVTDLSLAGSGLVRLGTASQQRSVSVEGAFRVVVPSGVPVRVVGTASVPDTWTLTNQGAEAPAGGEGWVLTVRPGASLSVVEGREAE